MSVKDGEDWKPQKKINKKNCFNLKSSVVQSVQIEEFKTTGINIAINLGKINYSKEIQTFAECVQVFWQ